MVKFRDLYKAVTRGGMTKELRDGAADAVARKEVALDAERDSVLAHVFGPTSFCGRGNLYSEREQGAMTKGRPYIELLHKPALVERLTSIGEQFQRLQVVKKAVIK